MSQNGIGEDFDTMLKNVTLSPRSSVYGDVWSSSLLQGVKRTKFLHDAMAKTLKADLHWNTDTNLEAQLKQVARLLADEISWVRPTMH